MCDATKKPRRTTVTFYCDQSNSEADLRIIDISEPNYCEYQIKATTKYLCTKLKSLPRSTQGATSAEKSEEKRNLMSELKQQSLEKMTSCQLVWPLSFTFD